MKITLRLFAVLREQAGFSKLAIELPAGATVATARDHLIERVPAIGPLFQRVAYAVNRSYVQIETELHDGDELALIPPVSGG